MIVETRKNNLINTNYILRCLEVGLGSTYTLRINKAGALPPHSVFLYNQLESQSLQLKTDSTERISLFLNEQNIRLLSSQYFQPAKQTLGSENFCWENTILFITTPVWFVYMSKHIFRQQWNSGSWISMISWWWQKLHPRFLGMFSVNSSPFRLFGKHVCKYLI